MVPEADMGQNKNTRAGKVSRNSFLAASLESRRNDRMVGVTQVGDGAPGRNDHPDR
jgi:hypothetical protein